MIEKEVSTPIAMAIATALVGSFVVGSNPQADTSVSPFAMTTLTAGYLLGAGGEGTCGGDKEGEAKEAEGSCGGDKEGEAKEDAEGKCGEGKCGAT